MIVGVGKTAQTDLGPGKTTLLERNIVRAFHQNSPTLSVVFMSLKRIPEIDNSKLKVGGEIVLLRDYARHVGVKAYTHIQ